MLATLKDDGSLRKMLGWYYQCRTQVLFKIDTSEGKGNAAKTTTHVVGWPTGLHHYPLDGGLWDQPKKLMQYFDAFYHGDRRAAFELMK